MKKKWLKDKKGFTLVELIVVLVILAILIALLVPALTGYIDKARQKAKMTECRLVVEAAQTCLSEMYGASEGADISSLQASLNQSEMVKAIRDLAEVHGKISGSILISDKAVVSYLRYIAEDGTIVIYEKGHEPEYRIDEEGARYSEDAPGYSKWASDIDFSMNALIDSTTGLVKEEYADYFDGGTIEEKTKKMKTYSTKRIQALFLQKNGGEYPKIDANEIKLPDTLKNQKTLENCVWKPMVTNGNKVIMVADSKGKNGSNANAAVVYYEGNYYYHDNGYGNLDTSSITDVNEKVDIEQILNNKTEDSKGKWVKI